MEAPKRRADSDRAHQIMQAGQAESNASICPDGSIVAICCSDGHQLCGVPPAEWTPFLSQRMTGAELRVVGPAALKTLMAYGGVVLDTRTAEGFDELPRRIAALTAEPDQLILLLVDDPEVSAVAARNLQNEGYTCVVLVSPAPELTGCTAEQSTGT